MAGPVQKGLKRRWVALAGAALIVGVLASGLQVSPASAQPLPPIACGVEPTGQVDWKFCVSHDGNGGVRAGALNFSYNKAWRFQGRVELSYHAFGDPGPGRGGRIIAWSDPIDGYIPSRGNLSTFVVGSFLPGIYCARVWNDVFGLWRDIFCVDTNGNQWTR